MPARVDVEDGDVVVRFSGWDRLWAIRRVARVPLRHVTGARAVDREELRAPWLRLFGTYVPGVVRAGIFRGKRGSELWMVRDGRSALVLDTYGRWARVVVETADPASDAERVLAARPPQ